MSAERFALLSAGVFLLTGMLAGIWKYWHMARSASASAPVYVDICHRTALLYAFACLVLQQLALNSSLSPIVNLAAVVIPIVFFALAVLSYAIHGVLQDTDNQLRKPHVLGSRTLSPWLLRGFMLLLIVGEIGGTSVLIAGNL